MKAKLSGVSMPNTKLITFYSTDRAAPLGTTLMDKDDAVVLVKQINFSHNYTALAQTLREVLQEGADCAGPEQAQRFIDALDQLNTALIEST